MKALPTEPSYSGTGRLYFVLTVGNAIRGKLDALRTETQARQAWDAKHAKEDAPPVLRDVSAKE